MRIPAGLTFLIGMAATASAADGAAVYAADCAKCHGDTGHADTPAGKTLKVPALAGDASLTAAAPADLVAKIKQNKKHASFVTKMSDDDLTAVVGRVKQLAAGK